MTSHTRRHPLGARIAFLAAIAAGAFGTACGEAASPSPAEPGAQASHLAHRSPAATRALPSEASAQLAQLRALTAPFHRFETAAKAGWGTRITGCFSDPSAGGMGYHYGNTALIDGRVNALEPELLLYEPQKNGRLKLVAVEYIVPFDLWTDAEPPSLYGQSFHRNEAFGLWVLHVWHFEHNPSGIFMDWNPRVTCEYARF